MRTSLVFICLATAMAGSGCYGTKVPPPERSAAGPLGSPLPVLRPLVPPDRLADLLAFYRRHLVETAHHLSPAMASRYAEIEVQTMASSFEGREGELRAILLRRMGAPTGDRQSGSTSGKRALFPVDPADSTGEQQ